MPQRPTLSRALLRRAENTELTLGSLKAISEIRAWLDQWELQAMMTARDKGATMEDIAEALGLTTTAIYHRFRNNRDGNIHPIARGRPKKVPIESGVADPARPLAVTD
jgi:predicted transcriptional regulator